VIAIFLLLICGGKQNLNAANGKVKAKETHQTMVGFGAAIAWGENDVVSNGKRDELYNLLFNDLGLDILRLRNIYRGSVSSISTATKTLVNKMYEVSPFRPKILMSSWTPPSDIKSNNSLNGGGNATLKKDANGKYMYGAFAKYWVDALKAYKSLGIEPDYISLQNELSYDTSQWESCRFDPTERDTIAGYKQALDSVYAALQKENLYPKILGAEEHGIGYNTFQNYTNAFDRSKVDGYCYHLYHGGTGTAESISPDTFNPNLTTIANNYKDKPHWQTEFDRGDWFQTVWLMHNCLVYGNVSAYLWWELTWGSGGKPLILLWWSGYEIQKIYWAFRQFSKYVDEGWKRVTTESDNNNLKVSAFINPENNKLTVVIINTGTQSASMSFDIQDFNASSGIAVRTSNTENGVVVDSNYTGKTSMEFPARSITTLSLSGDAVGVLDQETSIPNEYTLSQNYPNPFNPSTNISYQLPKAGYVSLKVYDLLGREVSTLVNEFQQPGTYNSAFSSASGGQVLNSAFASGVYFYTLNVDNNFVQTKKMILLR